MNLHIHFPNTLRIVLETDVPAALAQITVKLDKIMSQLDNLTAQVARETEVTASAVVLLKGLKTALDEAGTDPDKLAALSKQLGQNSDDLAAAVSENTPATAVLPTTEV